MADNSSAGDFDETFSRMLVKSGWRTGISASEALRRWRDFAADCIAGFPWDVDDYNNDLTLRTRLAEILSILEGRGCDAARQLSEKIEEADSQVRVVLNRDSFVQFSEGHWWLRKSPAYASQKFCQEFHDTYGIEIDSKSLFDENIDEITRLNLAGMPIADVLISARDSDMYISRRSGLLSRSFRQAFPALKRMANLVTAWIAGEVDDSELRSRLTQD